MSINLVKGQKIDLTKGTNLTKLRVGLGWEPAGSKKFETKKEKTKEKGFLYSLGSVLRGEARIGDAVNSAVDGVRSTINQVSDTYDSYSIPTSNIDIDASVVLLENDRHRNEDNLIYFGHRSHYSGAVRHSGDNTTGEGSGDDEVIYTDLSLVPSNVNRLVYFINIYSCVSRNQHFGMIQDAYIRIYDDSTGKVLCQFDLTDDYSGYTGIYVGEVYRYNGEWKFSALGEPSKASSISEMMKVYR